MISSNMVRAGHPSRVAILHSTPEGNQSGLHSDSVIMTDNLATILDSEVDRVIGQIATMSAVDAALRTTLGL